MSGCGHQPRTSAIVVRTVVTLTWPQCNWSLQRPPSVVAPQPATDSTCPFFGAVVRSATGAMPSTGASSWATAMSFFGDCWTGDWQVLSFGRFRTSKIKSKSGK